MAIHPLIAEAISGEPIAISDPKFYCKLLNNYLGLQEKHLSKNHLNPITLAREAFLVS
jgi:hypothetical protein